MMKILVSFLFVFLSLTVQANDIFKYTLEKHQKFEKTLSFDVDDNQTLHVLVVKNKDTKMYDFIPFRMNAQQEVKEWTTISFEEIPEIISYHTNGDTFTLLSLEDEHLDIIDYSISEGTFSKDRWEDFTKPNNIFKQKGSTVFLEEKENGAQIKITTIENASTVEKKEISVTEDLQRTLKKLLRSDSEIVDQEEYIEHGSISEVQAYLEKGVFYFVENDNDKEEEITLTQINPLSNTITNTVITAPEVDKLRDNNTQIKDGKLFAIFQGKEDFSFNVYDAYTAENLKSFTLSEQLSQLTGIRSKKSNYLKEVEKLKNRPTVAINTSKSGNYIVSVNYVDQNTYNYNNFWFMHFMMQQQMMMMQPGGFGPHVENFYPFYIALPMEGSKPLTFVLSKELELLDNASEEAEKEFVDKKKDSEQLQENKNIYHPSLGFLKEEYHYMYSDKKEDVIYIKSKPIVKRASSKRP